MLQNNLEIKSKIDQLDQKKQADVGANGGMTVLAQKAQLSRESLYRMLSKHGNPEIKSLFALLHAMGLRLAVEPDEHECPAA